MKKGLIVVFILIVAVGLVAGVGYAGFQSSATPTPAAPEAPPVVEVTTCDVQQTVAAPGRVINTREASIEMPVAGRLEEIRVRSGETVTAGQTLARLADAESFAAAVAAARLELAKARQELEALLQAAPAASVQARVELTAAEKALAEAQTTRTRLNAARADELVIAKAHADYLLAHQETKEAQKAFDKVAHKKETDPERLLALNALLAARQRRDRLLATWNWYQLSASPAEVSQAEAALELAEARVEEARRRYEALQAGPDGLQVDLAEARVADAQARLAAAEKDLANVEIRAPFDGVVLEVSARPGESLPAGAKVALLNDSRALEVEATILEEDLPQVEVGQPVEVFFDALPDEPVGGRVARVVPRRLPGDRPLYAIYITLDRVPEKLVAGMTADSAVVIARVEGVVCLPRAVVRAAGGDTASVRVWNGQAIEKRTVEVGLRGDTDIEIRSGLQAGEQVVAR